MEQEINTSYEDMILPYVGLSIVKSITLDIDGIPVQKHIIDDNELIEVPIDNSNKNTNINDKNKYGC